MTPIERVSIKSQALAILGLNSTTATEEDIRLAYRSRVREKHPDRYDKVRCNKYIFKNKT